MEKSWWQKTLANWTTIHQSFTCQRFWCMANVERLLNYARDQWNGSSKLWKIAGIWVVNAHWAALYSSPIFLTCKHAYGIVYNSQKQLSCSPTRHFPQTNWYLWQQCYSDFFTAWHCFIPSQPQQLHSTHHGALSSSVSCFFPHYRIGIDSW